MISILQTVKRFIRLSASREIKTAYRRKIVHTMLDRRTGDDEKKKKMPSSVCHAAKVSGLCAGSEGRNLEFRNLLQGGKRLES